MGWQSKSKKSNKSTGKQNNRGQGLSGQERMTLKMREKAKKKTAEEYSVEQLLEKNVFPPYESRITTTKLLIEAEEYELATEILESLLEEDDEVVQVWYLFGWVCYLQVEKPEETEAFKDSARTYLTKAKKLYVKVKCDDSPMLEHMEQLLARAGAWRGPLGFQGGSSCREH
ncbi:uncharacterized protein LOC117435683 [Acipenser ruthenus]|uniref:uncharacterized protein LOC117435683 n=1 Tax=Acipenser ruthenus TaxID=7906 RepID=UPI0027415705|nr:uncharacterized protein LOC117435683 [Acipenser ruthenus]